jgi:hypothetical protein
MRTLVSSANLMVQSNSSKLGVSVANRSKPQSQVKSNQRSNRTKSQHDPHVNDAPSLSVSDAGYRLGVSVSTVKRLIRNDELAWFRTRGPNGHIRLLAESVEKFRQPGNSLSAVASGPPVAAGKRESIEALRAEIEERRLKRDLSKLDMEYAEAERRHAATAQAEELERRRVVEEAGLQVARDAAERRAREREQEEATERREWTSEWLAWALDAAPKDAPREVELTIAESVEEALAKLKPEQPQALTHRLVLATIEKALSPWRRQKQIEEVIQLSRKELPLSIQRYFEPSEWEQRAMETARGAIRSLPSDSSFAQLREVAIQAGRQVAAEYAAEEARARAQVQAERERQQRESDKRFLISLGVEHASSYLQKLHSDGEIWGEDFERKAELQSMVREVLEARLTGAEGFEEAQRIAREAVDAELESK